MTDFNKENLKSSNFDNAQQVQQRTIIEFPRNNYIIQRSYCETLQKNKPQSNSVVGGEKLCFSMQILSFISKLHK